MSATGPARGKQQTFRDSAAFLRTLYEHAAVGIEQVSSDGRLLLANAPLCRMLGFSQHELLNKRFDELFPREDRARENRLLQSLFAGDVKCYDGSKCFLHRSGALIRTAVTSFVIGSDLPSRYCLSIVRDVSAFSAATVQLGLVIDSVPTPMLLVDEEGTIVLFNSHAEHLFGYPSGELSGQPVDLLVPDKVRSKHSTLRQNFLERPEKRSMGRAREVLGRCKDGTLISLEITLHPIKDDGRKWVLVSIVDIREHRRAMAALAKSEEKFYKVFHEAPIALTLTSTKDSRYLDVNEKFVEWTGLTRDEVIGRTPFDMKVWASDPEIRNRAVHELVAGGKVRDREFQFRGKAGDIRTALGSMELIEIDGEQIALGAVLDITDRKRSRELLEQSEKKFRSVFENAPEAMAMSSPQGKYMAVNKAFCDFSGYTSDELLGLDVLSITHPDDRPATIAGMSWLGISEESVRLEKRYIHKNGQTRWGDVSRTMIRDADGKPAFIVSQIMDVTERKLMEAELRRSEAALKEAQRVAQIGSWEWDPNANDFTCSEELSRISGLNPSHQHTEFKTLSRFFSSDARGILEQTVGNTLRTGESFELDLPAIRANGEAAWVTVRGEAVRNIGGKITGLRGTLQDITIRKHAEEALRGLSGKLIEAQERERKRIARELHDDINQRIAIVAVELQRLQSEPHSTPAQFHKQIDKLFKQTTAVAASIQALSHQLHSASLEYLGLAPAIKSLCDEIRSHHQVDINYTASDFPAAVPTDMSLAMFRVAQESLRNAIKHSGVKRFDVHLEGFPDAIQLTVRDSGVGFGPDAIMAGRGLGLISMRERIFALNGTVSIVSKPQHGTEVKVRIPLITNSRN